MTQVALELKDLVGRSNLGTVGKPNPVNIRVKAGEVGLILGGKDTSSLFRLIMGLGKVEAGGILIYDQVALDQNSDETDLNLLRKRIGFGFRDKGLISNLSILQNVDLPAKYHGYYTQGDAPGSLGAKALLDLGVDESHWNDRPTRLSSDIRKRVLLARSVVLNPRVLILDDPSALSASVFIPELLAWIKVQQAKGRGILIGTNDLPFGLAAADWIMHPTRQEPVTRYEDFIDPMWIKSARILTERMQRA